MLKYITYTFVLYPFEQYDIRQQCKNIKRRSFLMTENERNNDVRQAGYGEWVYMNECKNYSIETDNSVEVDCDTLNSSIKSNGDVIITGRNFNTPICAEKTVIVKSGNYSSNIKTKNDVFILGDCINSKIYTDGRVIIEGNFEGGDIIAKKVNILGEVGKNITITEI